MKSDTMSLATYLGYNFVRVTSGNKNYPEHTYPAVIDFYDFNDAQEFAERVNGKVVLLTKSIKDEHYTNAGIATNGIDVESFVDTNRYVCYTKSKANDFEQFALDYIKDHIVMGTDLCFIAELSEKLRDLYDEISTICNEDIIVIDKERWIEIETPLQYETYYRHNDTIYRIAVVDDETDEDVVKKENA